MEDKQGIRQRKGAGPIKEEIRVKKNNHEIKNEDTKVRRHHTYPTIEIQTLGYPELNSLLKCGHCVVPIYSRCILFSYLIIVF
jgi:hypothetical protein